ncbi:unnamed protein product [Tuber aestivum]|uniref:Uncharacterized protein n=1 Tax=Tuber aestivum TaxID=59557 RepID=A0A292PY16_9PEZI|nr:unnamed protein product [Tuber aestivum]
MLKHPLRQSSLRRPLLLLSTGASSSTPQLSPSASTSTPRKSSNHQHRQPSYFAASIPTPSPPSQQSGDHTPPSERSLNLGRTIQTLRSHLPTLLQTPLPLDILSPSITLNLFPSTHPHLPTVRGRVAYVAALWTAPVAWGRLPGRNRRLEVLSERMLGEGQGEGEEVFVVRWRACEKDEFCGVFLFEFDDVGRIGRHVIEEVERGGDTSGEGQGGKGGVVGVTEWLLGKARGAGAGGGGSGGGLAWQCEGVRGR